MNEWKNNWSFDDYVKNDKIDNQNYRLNPFRSIFISKKTHTYELSKFEKLCFVSFNERRPPINELVILRCQPKAVLNDWIMHRIGFVTEEKDFIFMEKLTESLEKDQDYKWHISHFTHWANKQKFDNLIKEHSPDDYYGVLKFKSETYP